MTAQVNYIDPAMDSASRTVGVCADVENPDRFLKPEMLASGVIHAEMEEQELMVPSSAVMWTGPRSIVFVMDQESEKPYFEAREVTLGQRSGDFRVIKEGVQQGEQVVSRGAFRVDSELQLADRFSMMNREPGRGAVPVHDHGGSGDAGEAGSHEDMDHDETDRQMDADENREPGSAMGKDVTDKFRQDFTGLVRKYLDLKNALFESDNAGAKQAAENFVSSLEAAGKHRMSGEPHMAWMEIYDALYSGAKTIQQSDNLEAMRRNFSSLSQNLAEAAVSLGIGMDLYMQFCPMAFDGKGAYWLSDSEKIENPYLPETMPGCGEVEKNWNLFEIKHRASAGRMRESPGFVLS